MRWILVLLVLLSGCSLIEDNPFKPDNPSPDVVPGQVDAVLAPPPGVNRIDVDALESFLTQLGFDLEAFFDLASDTGPCSGSLAVIDIGGVSLGAAIQLLEGLEEAGIAVPLGLDGRSAYSGGQTDYLSAINADAAFDLGLGGNGVTIAVLDSGVSDTGELEGRLLAGYNAIDDNDDTGDSDLHGTPVAVLAAGTTLGVARQASVLPVKVCEDGVCVSSDIIRGMCWAIDNAPDGPDALVMNLSLGGDSPSEIIRSVLSAAIGRGVVVAASGGNEGANGEPHYPAAHNLGGLMGVTSVEQDATGAWSSPSFSTPGDYIDIAAPGVDLTLPGVADNLSGTSFSTPLVSGTMAVLRGADAGLSPTEIQTCIEEGAQSLPESPDAVGAGLLDVAGALSACGL